MTDAMNLSGTDVFTSALSWLEGTLLGSAATAIAIIAVASVGFLMLTGRIDVRRAARVVLGCFILFGASAIAGGIMAAVNGRGAGADVAAAEPPPPQLPPPPAAPAAATSPYDPYAGAALPPR